LNPPPNKILGYATEGKEGRKEERKKERKKGEKTLS